MNWQPFERFWRKQNQHRRICFATAAGALLTAGVIAIVSFIHPLWTTAEGLALVGTFYLVRGLLDRSRPPRPAHSHLPLPLPLTDRHRYLRRREETLREAWKHN